jgi:magnesium-transporting ATPase (P-type)
MCKELATDSQLLQKIADTTKGPPPSTVLRLFLSADDDIRIASSSVREGDIASVLSHGVECADAALLHTNGEKDELELILIRRGLIVS